MTHKKRIYIIITVVLIAVIVIGMVAYSNSPSQKYSKLLQTADRFLEELNYERAIASYVAAIEIDPNQAEAYKGLTEAYLAWATEKINEGDIESAVSILEDALEELENLKDNGADEILIEQQEERIRELLESLTQGVEESDQKDIYESDEINMDDETQEISASEETIEETINRMLKEGATDEIMTVNDLTVFGTSIFDINYESARRLSEQKGFSFFSDNDHITNTSFDFWYAAGYGDPITGTDFSYYENIDDTIGISFANTYTNQVGFYNGDFGRGFMLEDSIGDILEKIGFNNGQEIAEYFYNATNIYLDSNDIPGGSFQVWEENLDMQMLIQNGQCEFMNFGMDNEKIMVKEWKIAIDYFDDRVGIWMYFDEDHGLNNITFYRHLN